MPRNRMTPETALSIELSAIISRSPGRDPRDIIAELQRVAGDHVDVLAETAGTWAGYYGTDRGREHLAAELATIPGAGPWVEVGRRRRDAGMHGAPRPGIDVPPVSGWV